LPVLVTRTGSDFGNQVLLTTGPKTGFLVLFMGTGTGTRINILETKVFRKKKWIRIED
jgi:hypothetical protein